MLSLHELLNHVTVTFVPAEGVFHWSWFVLGAPIVLAIGLVYARFLLTLPTRYRWLFSGAATVFFVGALAFEVIESAVVGAGQANTVTYDLFVLVEEVLEMVGVIIAIYGLAEYL